MDSALVSQHHDQLALAGPGPTSLAPLASLALDLAIHPSVEAAAFLFQTPSLACPIKPGPRVRQLCCSWNHAEKTPEGPNPPLLCDISTYVREERLERQSRYWQNHTSGRYIGIASCGSSRDPHVLSEFESLWTPACIYSICSSMQPVCGGG